jgi:asparagine synthase (glutamine-hydrolysing)
MVRPIAYEQTIARFWTTLLETFDSSTTGIPVEVCHPFFDLRMVHFLLALPTVPWCCDKELLREAGRGSLPDAIRLRRKSPLLADPLVALLSKPESAWVDEFESTPELERYVRRERVPNVFAGNDSWSSWIHLRPLSLNSWLSTGRRLGGNTESPVYSIGTAPHLR